jgi:hypothetical protein
MMPVAWLSYSSRDSSNRARPDTADPEKEHLQYLDKVDQLHVHLGIPWIWLTSAGRSHAAPAFSGYLLAIAHLGNCTWLLPQNPWMYTLPDSDGQVFVFHLPGVIQRVIRGVSNQISQWPRSGDFAFRMERPNGVAIGVAVRL